MSGEAKWALAGVIIGGLLTGAVSVYVEYIKGIRDDVRFRTQTADQIVALAATAVNEYTIRQVTARSNGPAMPNSPAIEPEQVFAMVGTHFQPIRDLADKFLKECATEYSRQHGLAVDMKNADRVKEESDQLSVVAASYDSLRQALIKEAHDLNEAELSHWYVLGVAQ